MVAAGQGIEGICLYLGLSCAALDESLVRLGLRTPHGKPLRKPGHRGWSAADITRLIFWRVAGVHPETIGERLGRKANAVRAKCRRLGIPTPPRNLLHKLDPVTLVDPTPGFTATACVPVAQAVRQRRTKSSFTTCGTAAGPAVWSHPVEVSPIVEARAEETTAPLPPPSPSQSELPLLRIVPSDDQASLPPPLIDETSIPPAAVVVTPAHEGAPPVTESAAPAFDVAAATLEAAPAAPSELRQAVDRARAAGRALLKDLDVAMRFMERVFSGQSYKAIATELGISAARAATLKNRLEIPSDPDRSKFRDSYDVEVGRANIARLGYTFIKCPSKGTYFARRRGEFGRTRCRLVREREGMLTEHDKYKGDRVNLILPDKEPTTAGNLRPGPDWPKLHDGYDCWRSERTWNDRATGVMSAKSRLGVHVE